jgi:hypothetical protein
MITLFQYYRIAAAFLIVMIHQQFWKPCSFVNGLENCAVPLFACLAGYLYKGGLLKKVPRVIIPYLLWAVIYFVANNLILDVFVRRESFEFPGLKPWLLGGTACHLWFLPCLFAAFAAKSLMVEVARLTLFKNLKPQTSNLKPQATDSRPYPPRSWNCISVAPRRDFGNFPRLLPYLLRPTPSLLRPWRNNKTHSFIVYRLSFIVNRANNGGGRIYARFG